MDKKTEVTLSEMIMCLSSTLDLISPAVVNHHKRVAYIAYRLAEEINLPNEKRINLLMAGALHDIGAFSLEERLSALGFQFEKQDHHAQMSYLLLKSFQPLEEIALLIRHHHLFWIDDKEKNQLGCHILHLADRVDALLDRQKSVLEQVPHISEKIQNCSGIMFNPELVSSFLSLAKKEFFWLDLVSPYLDQQLNKMSSQTNFSLGLVDLMELAKLFSRIIDFRSPFTATHSAGVASAAEALAELFGFSKQDCLYMRIAGYLHDLGKISVPNEILEKRSGLSSVEYNIIKTHTFHTYRILESIEGLDSRIKEWAAFHHERLNGEGYPFHLKAEELGLGSRILAVADVFTAITEDRPYRKGTSREESLKIIQSMADKSMLDQQIVNVLSLNYEFLNQTRKNAQLEAVHEYEIFTPQKMLLTV